MFKIKLLNYGCFLNNREKNSNYYTMQNNDQIIKYFLLGEIDEIEKNSIVISDISRVYKLRKCARFIRQYKDTTIIFRTRTRQNSIRFI